MRFQEHLKIGVILSRRIARELALQTIIGAAKLLKTQPPCRA